MREGRVVLEEPAGTTNPSQIAHAKLGENLAERKTREPVTPGEVIVKAEAIRVSPPGGKGTGIRNATFQIRAGETVGVAAIETGSARTLLHAVAGLLYPEEGQLSVADPVALVPEDRTREGIIADFTLTENLVLGLDRSASWVRRGIIHQSELRTFTDQVLARYRIAAPGGDAAAGSLSGGNQQKLVLARALERHPRVLIAENPGRGLDIRASRLAFEHLRAAARRGAGVIIHSSDLDELLEWCDRVLVVARGQVYSPGPHASRASIGRLLLAVPA
jgi:simple sugar transport system ATP-binding protein